MRVLTLKTQTPANIKFPGYLEYTINFKYYFHRAFGVYGENTCMKRELREHIYLYISEISIDMNRDRSLNYFFQWSFRSIRGKRDTKRELREHIYIYISEISIDESALASLAQLVKCSYSID